MDFSIELSRQHGYSKAFLTIKEPIASDYWDTHELFLEERDINLLIEMLQSTKEKMSVYKKFLEENPPGVA